MLAGAVPALATTDVNQSQSQELKVTCKVGSYGQNTECTAEGKQEQSQSVKVLGATTDKTHKVVDTALDLNSVMAASGLMISGVGAFALKRRINKV